LNRDVDRRKTTDDRYFLNKIDGKFIKSKGSPLKRGIAVVGGITFDLKKKTQLIIKKTRNQGEVNEPHELRPILKLDDKPKTIPDEEQKEECSRRSYWIDN